MFHLLHSFKILINHVVKGQVFVMDSEHSVYNPKKEIDMFDPKMIKLERTRSRKLSKQKLDKELPQVLCPSKKDLQT